MSKALKLGEACRDLDVQPYVLRYWESEFNFLRENQPPKGTQRTYSGEEMQWLRRVRELLYDEGYTIVGAKKKLDAEIAGGTTPSAKPAASPKEKEASREPPGAKARTSRKAKKAGNGRASKASVKKKAKQKAATTGSPGQNVLREVERDLGGLLSEARELLERLPG